MPIPAGPDPLAAYATTTDYYNIIGELGPSNLGRLLYLASLDIDAALIVSVYDADDPAIVTALRDACVEQVKWRIENGQTGGKLVTERSTSIGSVSLGPADSASAAAAAGVQGLDPAAWQILQRAGITGGQPITHVGWW